MKQRLYCRLGAGLLFCVLLQNMAAASGLYENGLKQYKSGKYKEAAQLFSAVSIQEPGNQLYHYLHANCLVHLDLHERACQEYKVAYLLDPNTSTADYCRQALLAYKKPLPSFNESARTTPDGELAQVKRLIEKQASFEKDKHESVSTNSQRAIKAQLDEDLRRIDQQMHADIQKLHEPIVFTPGPQANRLLALPELLKEREDQIKALALAEKERLIKESNERLRPYESWSKDRAALLDEAAGNLKTQLDSPAGPSGVKLQTRGTGLYVRYYGKSAASKFPDAHPATVRIKNAGDSAETNAEQAESFKKIRPNEELTVNVQLGSGI